MLRWLRQRRLKQAEARVQKMGDDAVAAFRAGVDQWRTERIALKREMLSNDFDERLASLREEEGLPYRELLEIEAFAFLNVWDDGRSATIDRVHDYVTERDMLIVTMGCPEGFVDNEIEGAWQDETTLLEAHVNETIEQAVKRHGEQRPE